MKQNKIAFEIGMVLTVLAVLTVSAVPAVNAATAYFEPQHMSAELGGYNYTVLWVDIEEGETLLSADMQIQFDPAHANITSVYKNCQAADDECWASLDKNFDYLGNGYFWGGVSGPQEYDEGIEEWVGTSDGLFHGPETVKICKFKLQAQGTPGVSPFNFGFEYTPSGCPICQPCTFFNATGKPLDVTWINGTFTHEGEIPSETFEKDLVIGWNLISLCFEPSDNSTSAVLSSISGNYSAVMEWDASSHNWVEATTMDRGKGYFVYVTTACTWNHTGVKKTNPMTIPLEPGLNLVGYPFNKTSTTSDALSGLNYYYAAPFDASTQKYEDTYNPVAPAPFNDFTTINPCEGFWISSKDGGDWTAS